MSGRPSARRMRIPLRRRALKRRFVSDGRARRPLFDSVSEPSRDECGGRRSVVRLCLRTSINTPTGERSISKKRGTSGVPPCGHDGNPPGEPDKFIDAERPLHARHAFDDRRGSVLTRSACSLLSKSSIERATFDHGDLIRCKAWIPRIAWWWCRLSCSWRPRDGHAGGAGFTRARHRKAIASSNPSV
jgi:hypothetical protein